MHLVALTNCRQKTIFITSLFTVASSTDAGADNSGLCATHCRWEDAALHPNSCLASMSEGATYAAVSTSSLLTGVWPLPGNAECMVLPPRRPIDSSPNLGASPPPGGASGGGGGDLWGPPSVSVASSPCLSPSGPSSMWRQATSTAPDKQQQRAQQQARVQQHQQQQQHQKLRNQRGSLACDIRKLHPDTMTWPRVEMGRWEHRCGYIWVCMRGEGIIVNMCEAA